MTQKKRVGYLYGRPVVEGDENEINAHEILAKREGNKVELLERGANGELVTVAPKKFAFLWEVEDPFLYQTEEGRDLTCLHAELGNLERIFNTQIGKFYYNSTWGYIMDSAVRRFGYQNLQDPSSEGLLEDWDSVFEKKNTWYSHSETNERLYKVTKKIIDRLYKESFNAEGNNTITPIPFLCYKPYISMAFDKKGVLQGIYNRRSSESSNFTMWIDGENSSVMKVNCKGESIEGDFITPYSVETLKPSYFESYDFLDCTVAVPLLFVSPVFNGAFTICAYSDSRHVVTFVKCVDLDMSFWRKKIGMPDSLVIPTSLGMQVLLDSKLAVWHEL